MSVRATINKNRPKMGDKSPRGEPQPVNDNPKSMFFGYQPPPFVMTNAQRGYYEFWISEVAKIYFSNLPAYTACERVKQQIKPLIGYTTSRSISKDQFQKAIQLLKAYIYKANPNYKPPLKNY